METELQIRCYSTFTNEFVSVNACFTLDYCVTCACLAFNIFCPKQLAGWNVTVATKFPAGDSTFCKLNSGFRLTAVGMRSRYEAQLFVISAFTVRVCARRQIAII